MKAGVPCRTFNPGSQIQLRCNQVTSYLPKRFGSAWLLTGIIYEDAVVEDAVAVVEQRVDEVRGPTPLTPVEIRDQSLYTFPIECSATALGVQQRAPRLVHAGALDLRDRSQQVLELVHPTIDEVVCRTVCTFTVLGIVLEVVGRILELAGGESLA